MEERIILVNRWDEVVGFGEKMQTHLEGALHRAFSILIFNAKGELLIQRRAKAKYHSGELWSNTCCGHPRPDEVTQSAARRRLWEEMGLDCELERTFDFIYKVKFDNGLRENEFDHVFVGRFNGSPLPNPEEVCDWKWIDLPTLGKDMQDAPHAYTHWFGICLQKARMLEERKNRGC